MQTKCQRIAISVSLSTQPYCDKSLYNRRLASNGCQLSGMFRYKSKVALHLYYSADKSPSCNAYTTVSEFLFKIDDMNA